MIATIGGLTTFQRHKPRPSKIFDTYWRFAAERQQVFHRRVAGEPPPWTGDAILATHRFTNSYRAADRVSQFLINEVIPGSSTEPVDVLFRTLLFKVFNRVGTWCTLQAAVGNLHAAEFDPNTCATVLTRVRELGQRIYSAAYIMPMPAIAGATAKHEAHLELIAHLLRSGTLDRVLEAKTLRDVYLILSGVPSFGPFLAFQFTIDLNYSLVLNHSEMEFVVAGPGARSGIEKCFTDLDEMSYEDVVRYTCERADYEFDERGLEFADLWGRPLHLVDCQNLFCEVDKYARVAHPEAVGRSNRTRIKQRYCLDPQPVRYGFPDSWNVSVPDRARWVRSGNAGGSKV
ncbi:MAG: nucleotide kinase domain-containing protein [Fimbriimonadales bacterium]